MSKDKEYVQAWDGVWFPVKRNGWLMKCCDCGLIHRVDFKIKKRTLFLRAAQDRRKTAAGRRELTKARARAASQRKK